MEKVQWRRVRWTLVCVHDGVFVGYDIERGSIVASVSGGRRRWWSVVVVVVLVVDGFNCWWLE